MNGISPAKAKWLADNRDRWHLGFNDPSFGGWAATGGYLMAGWLALLAARRAPARSFERRAWGLAGAALLFLGANKQLDLHILLIDVGRNWAVDHGFYQQRRLFQLVFMVSASAGAAVAIAGAAVLVRGRDAMLRLGLLGLAVTLGYAILRAAAFNHSDSLLRTEVAGVRWDWIVELAGIAVTGFAAWRYRAH